MKTIRLHTTQVAWLLALVLALAACGQVTNDAPAALSAQATLTVTSGDDSGSGTLRSAISQASSGDTITFADHVTTITLESPLVIDKNLTINGPAGGITISGGGSVQVMEVSSGVTLNLDGLTIANGRTRWGGGILNNGTLIVTNSTFSGNSADNMGGGIYNQGTLTVTNSTFSGNRSVFGGGIFNNGTLIVTNSTFSGNSATHGGGGIYNRATRTLTVTVTNSTFSGNTAEPYGGGILNDGTLTVISSTFSGNSADSMGGGIYNQGTLTVTDSTFSENRANFGGGILNHPNALTVVTNSTFSGNSAAVSGGSILNTSTGTLTLTNSTFSGNISGFRGGGIYNEGSLNLTNSIVALNTAPTGPDIMGAVSTASHNLIGDTADSSGITHGENGNIVNPDPKLGLLADNGGPTMTMALLAGSPAIGTALSSSCPATDQRGVARPQGNGCDIGAFEFALGEDPEPTRREQTITFGTLPDKTFGDAAFDVSASASSGLPVSFSAEGNCTVSASAVTITGAGECTITASQAGDESYSPAPSQRQSFAIAKATPTVTATGGTFAYDGTAKTGSGSATGVGGVALTPVTLGYKEGETVLASAPVAVGTYTVIASFAENDNYEAAQDSATITINQAVLRVTAENKTMSYGAGSLPTFTSTISGFVNGDDASVISGSITYSTSATTTSPAGEYAITPDVSGVSAANYSFAAANGTLTVSKATADIAYTGDTYLQTASSATVTLTAKLTNIDTNSPNGDLSLARVHFEISGDRSMVLDNVAVDALGNAQTSAVLPIGTYEVRVSIEAANGYWTGSYDEQGLTVDSTSTGRRVSGGGWVVDSSSANHRGSFAFTVTPQRNGSLRGNAVYLFRGSDGYNYKVKSNSWQGSTLSFNINRDPARASFTGRANVQKIDRTTGEVVESWGNYGFTVDIFDGEQKNPRQADSYAITIRNGSGQVWHQNGTPTNLLQLGGGNVKVQSK